MYVDSIFDYIKMAGTDETLVGAAGGLKIQIEELKDWSNWRETGKFPNDSQIEKIANFIQ